MLDIPYIENKLRGIADEGALPIAKQMQNAAGAAAKAGAFGNSNVTLHIQGLLTDGARRLFRDMATFLIEHDAHQDTTAVAAFRKTAEEFATHMVTKQRGVLFDNPAMRKGAPSFEAAGQTMRAALLQIWEGVAADMSKGVVGSRRVQPGGVVTMRDNYGNVAIGGDGSNVVAGDGAQQQVQQLADTSKLEGLLAEILARLPDDASEAKAQAKGVQDAIAKEPGRVRQAVQALATMLGKMKDASLTELGKKLGEWLAGLGG